ncbi:MAG: cytochrome b/b6 domain-containing protein [Pseudomonadota bacterium]
MDHPTQPADFSIGQKVLHWLIAVAIILDLFIAQKFGGAMTDADRFESRSDHASLGTLVACLFAIRLYLRFKHGAPPLPIDIPRVQARLAHLMHWALYVLIGLLILSGIGSAISANSIVSPFALFTYGNGVGNETVYRVLRTIHEFSTKAIIALIALHVFAALYHLFSQHRDLTVRMLKFWKSETAV